MKEVLISVIIPIYQVEEYLNKCIASVANQTYKNLEIILVDDGSPDNCPEICDKWSKKEQRIKVIHKKNGGLSDARNAGLKIAEGEFISFIDSDDFIALDMYECLLKKIKETEADLAICDYERIDENGNFIEEESPIKDEILTLDQAIEKLTEKKWWYYVTAWNKLYSKKSLKGIEFPVGKIHEDQFVAHKVFNNCKKIVCINQKKYFYVQRASSIMSADKAIRHLDSVEALCERMDFLKENNLERYLDGMKIILCREYQSFRYQSTKLLYSKESKNRIKKIDTMFKRYYIDKYSSSKEKIKYSSPPLYFSIIYIKNKISFKYRISILIKLLKSKIKK